MGTCLGGVAVQLARLESRLRLQCCQTRRRWHAPAQPSAPTPRTAHPRRSTQLEPSRPPPARPAGRPPGVRANSVADVATAPPPRAPSEALPPRPVRPRPLISPVHRAPNAPSHPRGRPGGMRARRCSVGASALRARRVGARHPGGRARGGGDRGRGAGGRGRGRWCAGRGQLGCAACAVRRAAYRRPPPPYPIQLGRGVQDEERDGDGRARRRTPPPLPTIAAPTHAVAHAVPFPAHHRARLLRRSRQPRLPGRRP